MYAKSTSGPCAQALHTAAACTAAFFGLATAMPAGAQGGAADWQYELTPYLWGSAMKGDVRTPAVPSTKVDMSFSDILDIMDFGAMGAFEARKGRWGLLFDGMYFEVSDGATVSRTGPLGNTLTASANLQVEQTLLAAALAYRVAEGRTPLDVIGGMRYSKIDVEVRADFTLLGLAATRTRQGDEDWIDPYVGMRIQHPLSGRWTFTGYADVGGFGVGSDSTWQVQAGLEYRMSDMLAAKFGYRVMETDYDEDGFVYDMKNDGLYLGLGIRF